MPVYLATYDLRKEENSGAYKPLIDALTKLDSVKVQKSVWLIDHPATQLSIYGYLKPHIDEDDSLMVTEVFEKPSWYRGIKGTNDWIGLHF